MHLRLTKNKYVSKLDKKQKFVYLNKKQHFFLFYFYLIKIENFDLKNYVTKFDNGLLCLDATNEILTKAFFDFDQIVNLERRSIDKNSNTHKNMVKKLVILLKCDHKYHLEWVEILL